MKKKTLLILTTTFLAVLGAAGLLVTFAQGRATAAPSPSSPQEAAFYDDQRTAARAAAWWLVSAHQNDDGGYAPFSSGANQDPSTVGGTADAMLALGAAGYPLGEPFPGKSQTPLDYLRSRPADVVAYAATGGGEAGKLVQALVVANEDPYDFAGHNLVLSLTNHLSPTGQYALTPYQHSLAILGLAAVSEPVPLTATQWLTAQQNAAGAWGDGFTTDENVDATGLAVMALVAADVPATATSLISATQFLADAQLSSGGWPFAPGLAESTNSTALALQALSALGEDFYSDGSPWAQDGTPLEALLAWQREGGPFQVDFGGGALDNFFATAQALPAVTGHPYPLPGRYESARQAIACLDTLQDPATGGWEQFAGFGVNAGGTSRAIQAIAAFGEDPDAPRWTTVTGTTSVQALEDLTPAYLSGGRGGRVGIVMQGVVAAGEPYSVTSFAGYNLPLSVTQYLSPTGEYDHTAFGPVAHDEAMLGLLVAGYPVDPAAVQWLLDAHIDGDWGTSDADGLSLNVLARLGVAPPEAIIHLRQTQGVDGGWWAFGALNTSASSEVIQGLVSAGHNPFDPSWSQVVSGRISNAALAVMAQQMGGGCWPGFDGSTPDPFATTDAVLLMMARPGWYAETAYLPAALNPAGSD